jgi:heptosyltransferase-2
VRDAPPAAERILVVQSGFLGDVVLTTPLLAALRRRLPSAYLAMLVTPAAAPLVAAHPALDAVLVDDKRDTGRGAAGLLRLARELRRQRFTLAVAAHKSVRTALVLRAAGIPRRIGFATAPGARLYTERVARPAHAHDRDRLLALLAPFGAVAADETLAPWVALDAATRARAAALLAPVAASGRPLAGVCPGATWRTKRWPAAAYGALVRRLEADGFACVLVGAPDERAITAAVRAAAGDRGFDLAGATDVAVLAAILARMTVVVTNDSAPMHLASALGVPQVAIFCATVPAQGYGPLGGRALVVEKDLACRPCGRHGGQRCPRGTDDCMELVEVTDVREAIERVRAA